MRTQTARSAVVWVVVLLGYAFLRSLGLALPRPTPYRRHSPNVGLRPPDVTALRRPGPCPGLGVVGHGGRHLVARGMVLDRLRDSMGSMRDATVRALSKVRRNSTEPEAREGLGDQRTQGQEHQKEEAKNKQAAGGGQQDTGDAGPHPRDGAVPWRPPPPPHHTRQPREREPPPPAPRHARQARRPHQEVNPIVVGSVAALAATPVAEVRALVLDLCETMPPEALKAFLKRISTALPPSVHRALMARYGGQLMGNVGSSTVDRLFSRRLAKRLVGLWLARVPPDELRELVETAFSTMPDQTLLNMVPFALAFVEQASNRTTGVAGGDSTTTALGMAAVAAAEDAKNNVRDRDPVLVFFQSMDANCDGVLSLEEMRAGCDLLGLTQAEATALFTKLDVNGDGVLSQDEFRAAGDTLVRPPSVGKVRETLSKLTRSEVHDLLRTTQPALVTALASSEDSEVRDAFNAVAELSLPMTALAPFLPAWAKKRILSNEGLEGFDLLPDAVTDATVLLIAPPPRAIKGVPQSPSEMLVIVASCIAATIVSSSSEEHLPVQGSDGGSSRGLATAGGGALEAGGTNEGSSVSLLDALWGMVGLADTGTPTSSPGPQRDGDAAAAQGGGGGAIGAASNPPGRTRGNEIKPTGGDTANLLRAFSEAIQQLPPSFAAEQIASLLQQLPDQVLKEEVSFLVTALPPEALVELAEELIEFLPADVLRAIVREVVEPYIENNKAGSARPGTNPISRVLPPFLRITNPTAVTTALMQAPPRRGAAPGQPRMPIPADTASLAFEAAKHAEEGLLRRTVAQMLAGFDGPELKTRLLRLIASLTPQQLKDRALNAVSAFVRRTRPHATFASMRGGGGRKGEAAAASRGVFPAVREAWFRVASARRSRILRRIVDGLPADLVAAKTIETLARLPPESFSNFAQNVSTAVWDELVARASSKRAAATVATAVGSSAGIATGAIFSTRSSILTKSTTMAASKATAAITAAVETARTTGWGVHRDVANVGIGGGGAETGIKDHSASVIDTLAHALSTVSVTGVLLECAALSALAGGVTYFAVANAGRSYDFGDIMSGMFRWWNSLVTGPESSKRLLLELSRVSPACRRVVHGPALLALSLRTEGDGRGEGGDADGDGDGGNGGGGEGQQRGR